MSLFSHVYNNFYSVGALIPTSFMLSLAIIFLIIPKKSKATLLMGIAFIYMVIFFGGYVIAAALYHPIAAYHRWLTLGVVNLAVANFAVFPFFFPDEKNPRVGLSLLIVLYLISFILTGIFFSITLHGAKIYHFAGHYWDFDADKFSKFFGIVIIAYMFIFLGTGIWRTIVTKTSDRWAVLGITIILFLAVIIPGVFNTLSRDGLIDRGTYQISQDLSTIIGFFAAAIIYINYTKDRTNFMVKILAISFATFLILFQGLTYFSLRDLENAYNNLRIKDLEIAINSKSINDEMEYLARYTIKGGTIEFPLERDSAARSINFTKLKQELLNTFEYEKIASLPNQTTKADIKKAMKKANPFSEGYKKSILAFAGTGTAGKKVSIKKILSSFHGLEKKIFQMHSKIHGLPNTNFKEALTQYLSTIKPETRFFKRAILHHIADSKNNGTRLKKEVFLFLAPMKPAGMRHYRKSSDGRHFTTFMRVDPVKNIVYEAGFSYEKYRAFLHPTSVKYIYMLAAILITILVGFQFFFRGAFIRPIKTLLAAMYSVSKGDLEVQVPILVEDELGFISRNFNSMVDELKEDKNKLNDYAENLEQKVEQRTAELKSALDELESKNQQLIETRDALWGEMELAKKIQTALLPSKPSIPGYEISAHMAPADEVGGDYYDIINLKGIDWIIIGDVSGHGVPAGLIMMMVQTSIHTVLAGTSNLKPEVVLSRINQVITENVKRLNEDKYMTITVLAAIKHGKFHFSGLHQDIMIYRAETDRIEIIETDGMWIGIIDDIKEMVTDKEFTLNTRDVMLLYTDGITEAWDKSSANGGLHTEETMYGDERLQKIFYENRKHSTEEIQDAILASLENYRCTDDVTMVLIRRTE